MRVLIALLFALGVLSAGECKNLMKKYHAPNPAIKTMKQIKRWAKRKLKNAPEDEKNKLLECMLARAADNPNKVTVAGE